MNKTKINYSFINKNYNLFNCLCLYIVQILQSSQIFTFPPNISVNVFINSSGYWSTRCIVIAFGIIFSKVFKAKSLEEKEISEMYLAFFILSL